MVENNLAEILSHMESGYLDTKYDKRFIESKCEKMNSMAYELENTNCESQCQFQCLSSKQFEVIRQFAVSNGGFMKNVYRREFYKKCFNLDQPSKLTSANDEIESTTWYKIIDLDVMRSISNHFFKEEDIYIGNDYTHMLSLLKTKTSNFLKKFFKDNYNKYGYEYFQGFHDITLYVILIFYNYENYAMELLKIIAKRFCKDYMVLLDPENKHSHFPMEILFDILQETVTQINPDVMEFLNENCEYVIPPSVLPWLITFFTHDIPEPFPILRILDYLLFSHPIAIFHIVANVK